MSEQVIQLIELELLGEFEPVGRPSTITVRGGRPMSRKELETALRDDRYQHYTSLDALNAHIDELHAGRDGMPS